MYWVQLLQPTRQHTYGMLISFDFRGDDVMTHNDMTFDDDIYEVIMPPLKTF